MEDLQTILLKLILQAKTLFPKPHEILTVMLLLAGIHGFGHDFSLRPANQKFFIIISINTLIIRKIHPGQVMDHHMAVK